MLQLDIRHHQGDFSLDARFQVGEGLTALIGPSGSGKTTLANIVAGLIHPQQGVVRFGDQVWFDSDKRIFVPPNKRRIGYVFQEGRLFPHLTALQNLQYGRRYSGDRSPVRENDPLIELLGIGHLLGRRPADLSGGEKSRVAIGRALFAKPRLLVMDEPLSALDPARKAEILPHLEHIRDRTGIPILYVSHLMEEVARLATSVIAVEAGRIVAAGDPADVLGGRADLPSSIPPGSFLSAKVEEIYPREGLMRAQSPAGPLYLRLADVMVGETVRVHIPATDIALALGVPENTSMLNRLQGVIESLNEEDHDIGVIVNCAGERITARITRRSAHTMALERGKDVCLLFKSVSISRQGLFHRQA